VVNSAGPSHQRAGLRLALLAFAQFIIAVDYNIVYVALPRIGSALGFSAQSLQWVRMGDGAVFTVAVPGAPRFLETLDPESAIRP